MELAIAGAWLATDVALLDQGLDRSHEVGLLAVDVFEDLRLRAALVELDVVGDTLHEEGRVEPPIPALIAIVGQRFGGAVGAAADPLLKDPRD